MQYRKFGSSDMMVSSIGFGAWAIGGPVEYSGSTPISWGISDDQESLKALKTAFDIGVNFYDTADFYGLGHSEELIGQAFGNDSSVIIATKVGHRLDKNKNIILDYSSEYIRKACELSLKRLRRDRIDLYQLHSAKLNHLETQECQNILSQLQREGKIRYWGISLNTFNPFPEAEYLMDDTSCQSFQLVFNILNQRSLNLIKKANEKGKAIIARMPLQFGLLSGKFNSQSEFSDSDHRKIRLNKDILSESLKHLKKIWKVADKYEISKVQFALSYILFYKEISVTIPGMRTVNQVIENTAKIIELKKEDIEILEKLYNDEFTGLIDTFQKFG